MTARTILEDIRQALEGRPGRPIVLGVCNAVAQRFGFEAWKVRAATLVLGMFFTLATLAVYLVLGFVMGETGERTHGVMRGLGIQIREWCERCTGAFDGQRERQRRSY